MRLYPFIPITAFQHPFKPVFIRVWEIIGLSGEANIVQCEMGLN